MDNIVEQRTADQNRFYWRMIGNWSRMMKVAPEDLHDFLKNKFLRDLRTLKIGSTTGLNKSEFVRYLDDVTDFLTAQKERKMEMTQSQYLQPGYPPPQPQGYPPPQGAGYPQPPPKGYQQPENLYVGSGKTRQTQYGGIFKLSFSADDLRKMQQYLNESGWVTIDILQRREISPSGSTHYGKIDTWRPQPQGYSQPQGAGYPPPPPQGYPQQRATGYPPPPPQGYPPPPQRHYDDGGFSQTAPPQYNSAPQPPPPPQVSPPAEHKYSTDDIPQMPIDPEDPPF